MIVQSGARHLLETAFSEPLLRTLLRTLFYCKIHSRPPSQNPSENPFPRTLPRTFSEPFLERCVAVRPPRRAPYCVDFFLAFIVQQDDISFHELANRPTSAHRGAGLPARATIYPRVEDGQTTTTTIFELISPHPFFQFWGTLGCRIKCPFYTEEHRENTKIIHLVAKSSVPFWCDIRCKTFFLIMVVVVDGPSLKEVVLQLHRSSTIHMKACAVRCKPCQRRPRPWGGGNPTRFTEGRC